MVTGRLLGEQSQSFYILRVLALIHALAFIGLVVFIDGPRDGLHWLAIAICVMLCVVAGLSGYQILNATIRKSIYGHWVATKKTIAVMRPGEPRKFYRRQDCTGFTLPSWLLSFRGGQRLTLKLCGMGGAQTGALGRDLVQMWWPEYAKSQTGKLILDRVRFGFGMDNVRVVLSRGGGNVKPQLVYRRMLPRWGLMVYGVVVLLGISYLYDGIEGIAISLTALMGQESGFAAWTAFATNAVCLALFSILWCACLVYAAYQNFRGKYVFFSSRGLRMHIPGCGRAVIRPRNVIAYNPISGILYTRSGAPCSLAVPSRLGAPMHEVVRAGAALWQLPGRANVESRLRSSEGTSMVDFALILTVAFPPSDFARHELFPTLYYWGVVGVIGGMLYLWRRRVSRDYIHLQEESKEDTHGSVGAGTTVDTGAG